jgi:hypothetical protein
MLADLSVPTFPDAVISAPSGARARRPVIIVFRSRGEPAERSCEMWRQLTAARGFVVCPRDQEDVPDAPSTPPARPAESPYARRGGVNLRDFVDVLLDSLGTRFLGYVDGQRPVLVASQTLTDEVARIASDDPRRFPRIVLLDGGADSFSPARIHAFHWSGGDRVLFGCTSGPLFDRARRAARELDRAGVESHAVRADAKRTSDDAMKNALADEWTWFLGDDPRWAAEPRRP